MRATPLTTSSGLRIGSREPMRYKLSHHEFNIQSALIDSPKKWPRWKTALNTTYFVTMVTGVVVAIWRWL